MTRGPPKMQSMEFKNEERDVVMPAGGRGLVPVNNPSNRKAQIEREYFKFLELASQACAPHAHVPAPSHGVCVLLCACRCVFLCYPGGAAAARNMKTSEARPWAQSGRPTPPLQ